MASKPEEEKVYCIHIPYAPFNQPDAYMMVEWKLHGSQFAMHMFDELHDGRATKMSLEFHTTDGVNYVCFWTGTERMGESLKASLYSFMDAAEIRPTEDYTKLVHHDTDVLTREIRLGRNDILPIQDFNKFSYDTLSPIIPILQRVQKGDHVILQTVIEPLKGGVGLAADLWFQRMKLKAAQALKPSLLFKKDLKLEMNDRARVKCDGKLYLANVRVSAFSDPIPGESPENKKARVARLREYVEQITDGLLVFNTSHGNIIKPMPIKQGLDGFRPLRERQLRSPILLMPTEVVTFWHALDVNAMPTAAIMSRKCPPPQGLPTDENDQNICFFGHTNYRDHMIPFGIKREDRKKHLYTVGKSGSGKSCLLQLLVRNDIEDGFGCAVLDPHGDLVDNILKYIPKHRVKDVVLFDPSDTAFPPAFNPINTIKPELRMRATVGFLDVFRKVFGADWSERLEHIVRYATLALLNVPTASLVSLRKMLTDDVYRGMVLRHVNDESVKRFWQTEFVANKAQYEQTAISALLNRLDQLLATDMVRNIVGQPMNLFNFREFMDTRKIVLIKISKGLLGADIATLLGSLVIAKIYEAAMSRADQAVESRKDFYFYIDEFQNFATESFSEIMSESRKYGLCLTVANQYLGQLPADTKNTVFGNVGNLMSFRVGAEDAGAIANEFKPRTSPEDLKNLPSRDFFVKMSINGEVKEAFSGRTLELRPVKESDSHARECIEHSRSKYCVAVDKVREIMNIAEFSMHKKSEPAANS